MGKTASIRKGNGHEIFSGVSRRNCLRCVGDLVRNVWARRSKLNSAGSALLEKRAGEDACASSKKILFRIRVRTEEKGFGLKLGVAFSVTAIP